MAALPNYAPMTDRRRRKLAKAEAKRVATAPVLPMNERDYWFEFDTVKLTWQLAQPLTNSQGQVPVTMPAPQLLLAAPPPLKLLPAYCKSSLEAAIVRKQAGAVLVKAAKRKEETPVAPDEWAAFVRSKAATGPGDAKRVGAVAMSAAEGL